MIAKELLMSGKSDSELESLASELSIDVNQVWDGKGLAA